jgi:hypothetical protein
MYRDGGAGLRFLEYRFVEHIQNKKDSAKPLLNNKGLHLY